MNVGHVPILEPITTAKGMDIKIGQAIPVLTSSPDAVNVALSSPH